MIDILHLKYKIIFCTYFLFPIRRNIERDQALVKKLIAKALRFVQDQELEERKREKLEARIAELTEQKKVAEKLARSFASQRETAEKQVRFKVT